MYRKSLVTVPATGTGPISHCRLARSARKSALRQPEALFSFTRPIGRVGSSVVEQRPFKPLVVGSNPTRPTTLADSQPPIPSRATRSHLLGSRRPDSTPPALALDERVLHGAQRPMQKISPASAVLL